MIEFKAALINEIEKLYKKKKMLLSAIISFIIIILGQIVIIAMRNGFGLRGVSNTEFPILVLSLMSNIVLPLFTALVTIDSFSGEFSHNTMKISLTMPITRLKLFTAKLISITVFILSNLFFVMIFSITAGLIFNSNTVTLLSIFRIILSYTVTIFPMIVCALMVIFLSNIFKSGISVFFLSILIFMLFKFLSIIFFQYSSLFFISLFDWYKLWIMITT
ncbi:MULTISPECIES: ABC transporter permease [Clostridium]|uniref:ABC transporter permease n=1 Tax=Clostridium TaxID=1485 RepID=UPI001FA9D534|nr:MULTISPECIES: ABC transporter permease [Clostridium]